jgi:LPS-assembly protein
MTGHMNALQRHRGCLYFVLLSCVLAAPVRAADPAPAAEPVPSTQAAQPAEPLCSPAATVEDADSVAPAAAPAGTIRWSACHLSVAANGDAELIGDVAVMTDGRQMHCDRLDYLAATQELKLSGTVRLEDAAIRVVGDAGNYGSGGADFTHAQFELLQHPGRGEAESIDMHQPNVVELNDVSYTSCPKDAADWWLKARRITLDTKSLRGVGHHTLVVFKGVPILYLPWISFPLSDARQTGFLYPTIGSSSRNGATFSIPWYWDIAPNQDFTATPTYFSRRGLNLGGEYRYLTHEGQGTLRADFLPHDQLYGQDRSWQRLEAVENLGERWRAQANVQNVSDSHYFEDFGQGPQASSTVFLPRDLSLTSRNDTWQLGAQFLNYQTLDDTLSADQRPYEQAPRLTANGRWAQGSGLGADLQTELIDFRRDIGATGWRGWAQPGVGYDYTRPGFYLRPHAAWDVTTYRLSNTGTSQDTYNRSLPVLTLDTAMRLERETGSRGARVVTLEPRLKYTYIPYRDQSAIPVFDTDQPDPNYVSLFATNRYAGLDRIGDANDLTLGVTTRMLESSTGQQYLSATLGQSVHFTQPRVTLPGQAPDTSKRSDLLANIDLLGYRHWNLHYELAWNPQNSQTEKSILGLQYLRSGTQVVNLDYRYTQGSVDQADASTAWPVGRHWDLYARGVYSFLDHRATDTFAGFQYHENCWGLRFVVRDAVTSRSGARETSWYLQLELKGLSSVGSGASSFLHGSIQGYSPP